MGFQGPIAVQQCDCVPYLDGMAQQIHICNQHLNQKVDADLDELDERMYKVLQTLITITLTGLQIKCFVYKTIHILWYNGLIENETRYFIKY